MRVWGRVFPLLLPARSFVSSPPASCSLFVFRSFFACCSSLCLLLAVFVSSCVLRLWLLLCLPVAPLLGSHQAGPAHPHDISERRRAGASIASLACLWRQSLLQRQCCISTWRILSNMPLDGPRRALQSHSLLFRVRAQVSCRRVCEPSLDPHPHRLTPVNERDAVVVGVTCVSVVATRPGC